MIIEITGMNICPQFYFHIKSPTKLEQIIPHFSLYMDYIHYCPQSIYYHPDPVKT